MGEHVAGDRPLDDLRVACVGTGLAPAYAVKMLVDAGAQAVRVEPAGGDPLRAWSASGRRPDGEDGALFRHLAAGTRSVVGTPEQPAVRALLTDADLVVDDGRLDVAGLRRDAPRLVVVSVTPYGLTGPYAGRPATEFTVQAECGSIAGRGVPERPPVQAGGRIAEWSAGAAAAAAGLAAVRAARRTGAGAAVDVSWLEAMTLATNLFSDTMQSLAGRPPLRMPARSVEIPSIYPTADGWVGFNTNGPQHYVAFTELVERPDLLDEPWRNLTTRLARRPEFEEIVRAWTTRHTTAEVLARASELRVPAARVNDARSLLDEEHLTARGFFPTEPGGAFRHPAVPYRIDGTRLARTGTAPALDADAGAAWPPRPAPAPVEPPAGPLPLAGLKVLDLTAWWAGPAAAHLLAALGADVVHLESPTHPDPMRYAAAVLFLDRDKWWEYSAFYLSFNTDKRGIAVDLAAPAGREVALRLAAWADVVVENYTPRVMPRLGLGEDEVRAANPRALYLRMPAFGLDGPWASRVGFAQTMEQLAGMAWVTGHADAEPLVPRGPCDPVGGIHAAFAALVALARRDRTGQGALVEVPLVESALSLTAEQVVEFTAYGAVLGRDGNRSPGAAPQGLYACRGEEQWLALSVADPAHWAALCAVTGRADWAGDPGLADPAGRRARHDELDAGLTAWAGERDLEAAVAELLAAGVPAAALTDPRRVHAHPQLVARGFVEEVTHPVVGTHPLLTLPFRLSGVDRWTRAAAPCMGEHNHEVLRGLLGMAADEVAALEAAGVVADRPAGS